MFQSRKYLKVWPATLVIAVTGASLLALGCTAKTSPPVQEQVVTVGRGDLSVDITSTGAITFSKKEKLSFDLGGTVAEVLVEEGDSVTEGQVLVRIDASEGSEWQKQIDALEDKVAAAEKGVTSAEKGITTAERQVVSKQRDLLQAQINLETTQDALETTQEAQEAADNVTQAEYDLRLAKALLEDARLFNDPSINYRQTQVNQSQAKLDEAKRILADVQASNRASTSSDVMIKRLQVELAQGKMEDAEKAIEDARQAVEDAGQTAEDAREALIDAQKAWEEAKAYKTELTAPFAGLVMKLNVASGDAVQKNAAIVELASDTAFYADVLVGETDIAQVTAGSLASVQVEAIPSLSLPATVARIAPAATGSQGVVNYRVKVEVQSVPRMLTTQASTDNTSARQSGRAGNFFGRFGASGNITPGQLPEQFQQALRDRGLTQEQVQEMMRNRMQGLAGTGGMGQVPATTVPQQVQLREGMTVTVTITVDQRNNVIVVPNRAITRQNGQYAVRVQTESGAVELRPVTVGINDFQYTEVTSGLSEGEKVIFPQSTSTATGGTTRSSSGQRFMIPGGGMLR